MRSLLRTLVLVAWPLLQPAQVLEAQSRPELGGRLGVAFGDSLGGCLFTGGPKGLDSAKVTLIWPPAGQAGGLAGAVLVARVGADVEECSWIGLPGNRLEGARLEDRVPYLVFFGVAGLPTILPDRIDIDLTGDGKHETVRVCTSNEGVHFTVWAGPSWESQRLGHEYAPLGYDVEPSCRRIEYDDPAIQGLDL